MRRDPDSLPPPLPSSSAAFRACHRSAEAGVSASPRRRRRHHAAAAGASPTSGPFVAEHAEARPHLRSRRATATSASSPPPLAHPGSAAAPSGWESFRHRDPQQSFCPEAAGTGGREGRRFGGVQHQRVEKRSSQRQSRAFLQPLLPLGGPSRTRPAAPARTEDEDEFNQFWTPPAVRARAVLLSRDDARPKRSRGGVLRSAANHHAALCGGRMMKESGCGGCSVRERRGAPAAVRQAVREGAVARGHVAVVRGPLPQCVRTATTHIVQAAARVRAGALLGRHREVAVGPLGDARAAAPPGPAVVAADGARGAPRARPVRGAGHAGEVGDVFQVRGGSGRGHGAGLRPVPRLGPAQGGRRGLR